MPNIMHNKIFSMIVIIPGSREEQDQSWTKNKLSHSYRILE